MRSFKSSAGFLLAALLAAPFSVWAQTRLINCYNPPGVQVAYDTGLQPGWQVKSWDAAVQIDPLSTQQLFPGNTVSLRVIIPGKLGASGVEIMNPNFSSLGLNSVAFTLRDTGSSGVNTGEGLRIAAFDRVKGAYNTPVQLKGYASAEMVGNSFRDYTVNLNHLGVVPQSSQTPVQFLGASGFAIINDRDTDAVLDFGEITWSHHQGYAMSACIPGTTGDGSKLTVSKQTPAPGEKILVTVEELPGADLTGDFVRMVCSNAPTTWVTTAGSFFNVATTAPQNRTITIPATIPHGSTCTLFLLENNPNVAEVLASTTFQVQ